MLTLDHAKTIIDRALARGRELNLAPLTVVVLDAGGHMVAMQRQDNSGILRPQIALGKAYGSLGLGESSRAMGERLKNSPYFVTALQTMSDGRVVPAPGGVLIRNDAGQIIGAVGISGDLSAKDEACGIAGVLAAGLRPEPAQPEQ